MALDHLVTALGILCLIACGTSQSLDAVDTSISGSTPPTTTSGPANHTGGCSKNSSLPEIQDQTAQTFMKLESSVSNETELLASVYKNFKDTVTEAMQNLSKIDKSKLDVRPITNEMNTLSTIVGTLYDAAGKRLNASLLTVGRLLNTSIASFIKTEKVYIGKMKLSPDARSISSKLRQVEHGLYRGLSTCLHTFNGSVVSDIFTVSNIFDTYFMDIDTFVNGTADCSSVNCAALSKTLLANLASWKTSTTATFNKIPTTGELKACIASQVNTARNDLEKIVPTILPPVNSRAVITNQTTKLETDANNLLTNFSNTVQMLMNAVVDKINNVRIFVGRNARDDPKSIIDSNFKLVTTSDDLTTQLMKTIIPRITTVSRRLIVPLITKENAIQRQIEATLKRDNSLSTECDTAIQSIVTIKHTFNNSMIACFNGTKDSSDAILTATVGMINGSLITFTNQIASADQFDCGRNCTITAMQGFAQQLKNNLELGTKLLVELRKSVTEQANRVYTAFESCMDSSVKKALDDLNEQTNADIKSCLAAA